MIVASAIAAWAVLSLAGFRHVFRDLIGNPGNADWADLVLIGFAALLIAAIFGPFVVLGLLARRAADARGLRPEDVARAIGGEGRADKIARLEQEAKERQRRIADLERDLGIEKEEAA
jgi:hypothetical protein